MPACSARLTNTREALRKFLPMNRLRLQHSDSECRYRKCIPSFHAIKVEKMRALQERAARDAIVVTFLLDRLRMNGRIGGLT